MKRRSFIQKASIATAGMISAFHTPSVAQNRKIRIGLIGCGWYGMVITKSALKTGDVEIVAACDVDSEHLKNSVDEIAGLQGSRPKEFKDYRDLLEVKEMDSVFIVSPPHWHALQFIAACEKGFDIYCEKPLAYDVLEGQAMIAAAEKAGNIVQVGFQRRQSAAFQKTKDLIFDGKLGKIHQIGAQIHYVPNLQDTTIQEPPASLDWDAWCGPAPKLPYRPNIGHFAWRLEKEYGNGHLVDWGIHHIDIIRKIMGMDMPQSVDAKGDFNVLEGKITTPDTLTATMNFEECPVIWEHRLWGSGEMNPEFNNGIFFYGEKGTLFAADNRIVLMPAGKNAEQEEITIRTPDMQDRHVANFVEAVKAKDKNLLSCRIQDAAKSTATVQLAMAAFYSGSPVEWSSEDKTITNNNQAKQMLARNYRNGYRRP